MAQYVDLAAIRNSSDFVDRCTISVANYAKYIMGEATTVSNHVRRWNWAAVAIFNPGGVVSQLGNAIVLDTVFVSLANGTSTSASLTDAQIDGAVQTAINNYVPLN